MWMEKLSQGVLRVLTPLGPRYLNPSFVQRLYLLWIFRNFETLPVKVLSPRQQRRIDAMCARHGFVSVLEPNGLVDTPLLGTSGATSAGCTAPAAHSKRFRRRRSVRGGSSAALLKHVEPCQGTALLGYAANSRCRDDVKLLGSGVFGG